MYFSGVTLNIISLSGLALGVGMLVDNSVVVIENVFRLKQHGISTKRAAIEGASQVAGAIVASTLTTVWCVRTDYFYRRCDKAVIRRLGAYPCLHTGSKSSCSTYLSSGNVGWID